MVSISFLCTAQFCKWGRTRTLRSFHSFSFTVHIKKQRTACHSDPHKLTHTHAHKVKHILHTDKIQYVTVEGLDSMADSLPLRHDVDFKPRRQKSGERRWERLQ